MRDFLSRAWYVVETGLFIVAILASIAGVVYLASYVSPTVNGVPTYRDEYTETCTKIGGTVVYNGKHLECLK